ncbi:MAG: ATP phosphoribosyltransferase regulatory subunit [Eubacteriales bacterium]|nr:ATP phosphoribosyltransferase regulatory subunit [Eubacteriales bacterium]
MYKQILHTPEGVRDIYNGECRRKQWIQDRIHQVLSGYGYQDIQTPTFEFFDVFSREVGTAPSRELYKFFDREGNTLVLRPDVTPSIARAVAKYFSAEDMPVRLCYMANTFINSSDFQGRLKETTQLGAELIGDGSPEADAEMLAMVVESLLRSGLTEFQVSVGHVGFFKSLLRLAGLPEEQQEELRELISNKNIFGVQELLAPLDLPDALKEGLSRIPDLFGSVEILEEARRYAVSGEASAALERLSRIYSLLGCYGYDRYVTFDLGVVSKYKYYTGIIFQAYTYGTGEPIAKGGRYDTLMDHFGKSAPAIGFVCVADRLLTALNRQNIALPAEKPLTVVLYEQQDAAAAVASAQALRNEGGQVELLLADGSKSGDELREYARRRGASVLRYFQDGAETVVRLGEEIRR